MKLQKAPFSLIAFIIGLMLLVLLMISAPEVSGGEPKLPLLTMLIISEFGFIVNAIGAFTAIRSLLIAGINQFIIAGAICCTALSIKFMMIGISYWPL